MTQTTLTKKQQAYKKVRAKFSLDFESVKDHSEIKEDLCLKFVEDLKSNSIEFSDSILVIDSTPNLCLHLKEAGFTNLTYVYNGGKGLRKWVSNVKGFCASQKIKALPFNLEKLPMKKFKAVVGNPPFQSLEYKSKSNNLWSKFLALSFESADYVSLVLPGSALSPTTFSKYKDHVTYVNLDVRKFFPGVGSTFCTLTLNKDPKTKFITIQTKDETFEVLRSTTNFISLSHSSKLESQIQDFLSGGRKWLMGFEYENRKDIFCDDGKYEVFQSQRNGYKRTNVYHSNNDLIRVSVDLSGKPRFRVIENMGLTNSHIWTVFETREEAEAYATWANSEEVQEFLIQVKWGGFQVPRIIKQLK